MVKNEIWRAVKNYEGIYQVSSLGRVRRLVGRSDGLGLRLIKPRILNQITSRYGYKTVSLCWKNKVAISYVHRLVLEAFVGRCPEGKESDHKDFNTANNCAQNLQWVTHKENVMRAGLAGRRKIQGKRDKKIMSAFKAGMTRLQVSIKFGVEYKNTCRIIACG